jgi:hypothetical protein
MRPRLIKPSRVQALGLALDLAIAGTIFFLFL